MIEIIVRSNGYRFDALIDGKLIGTFREPLFSACRHLLGDIDRQEPVCMRWEGSPHPSLTTTVGRGAALTVVENSRTGPKFAAYREFDHDAVE